MSAYNLASCALSDLVSLLVTEKADSIRLETGTHPLLTVKGQDFLLDGPAVADGVMEEILRAAGNTREVRALREEGKVEILHNCGDSRFLIRAINASAISRVEVHLLKS